MSNRRFYSPHPLAVDQIVPLSEAACAHAVRVLRLAVGDALTLFCGDGHDYLGELIAIEKKSAHVRLVACTAKHNESPLTVRLLQGISSGDRMDYTLQKAVELGVSAIYPLSTERSVTKLSGDRAEKRIEHWQGVVIAACEQSGRAVVPIVHAPCTLAHWLKQFGDVSAMNIVLNPEGAKRITDLQAPHTPVNLLIGSEGGLSPSEITLAMQHQFQSILLGPRILRTETAALTALACMQAAWGDF